MKCATPYDTLNDITTTLSRGDVAEAKSALLTLHFLFPHELLPALDLLDRQLVTRLTVLDTADERSHIQVYYVQSASATVSQPNKASRHQVATTTSYEVRLAAWNCTCPAFAYSAFGKSLPACLDLGDHSGNQAQDNLDSTSAETRLGGVLSRTDSGVPICKHILAAFLGAAAPNIFGNGVCVKEVTEAEVAGWAGGWRD